MVCFMGSSGEGAQGLRGTDVGHPRGQEPHPITPDARAGPHREAQASLGSRPMSSITAPCMARSQTPRGSETPGVRGEAAPLEDLQGLEASPGAFSIPLA